MPEKLITIERTTQPDKGQIKFEEVAELELPIRTIIEKIKTRIDRGEYGLIVGDDASGRVPAIILGNFIRKVSELKGHKEPNIIFIPGKIKKPFFQLNPEQKLDDYIRKFGATKEHRILIVTDTVLTGDSLATLVGLLQKRGFVCDIATIGVETDENDLKSVYRKLGYVDVISGEYHTTNSYMPHTPKIYREKTLSGVTKRSGKIRSTPIASEEPDEEDKKLVQDHVNQTRKDARVVTDHLVDWYESLNYEK